MIPAYNAAHSIKKAIDSCMQQTLKPYEIIVVNDASTDNTHDIAMQYNGVLVITLNENSGPSKARNKGWNAAAADIVAFLDADDSWKEDKLKQISSVFAGNNDIQLLGHDYEIAGHPTTTIHNNTIQQKTYTSILLKNPFQPSCMAIRREIPLRFDETYRYCEDHELAIRIASQQYGCYWYDAPLTILGRPQLSKGGASGNIWKMRKGELRLYTSIYRHNLLYLPLIPILWLYSMCKMAYKVLQG